MNTSLGEYVRSWLAPLRSPLGRDPIPFQTQSLNGEQHDKAQTIPVTLTTIKAKRFFLVLVIEVRVLFRINLKLLLHVETGLEMLLSSAYFALDACNEPWPTCCSVF